MQRIPRKEWIGLMLWLLGSLIICFIVRAMEY